LINPSVSIIILNWNGWEDTLECLESLLQIDYSNYTIILIDNGSTNNSIKKIIEYADGQIKVNSKYFNFSCENKPIKYFMYSREETESIAWNHEKIEDFPSNKKMVLIKNEKNFGFAEGNNIGIRYALMSFNPDYILLLNNDTVVDKFFLKELIIEMEQNEKTGAAGPKIFFYDFEGKNNIISCIGGKINFLKGLTYRMGDKEGDHGQYENINNPDYIEGSCLLMNTGVIKKIGILNPNYFTYWEEVDWCTKAKNAGYQLKVIPKAMIWHKIAASDHGKLQEYYMIRNRFLYLRQHASKIQYLSFLFYFFGYQFWIISGSTIITHKNFDKYGYFLRGIIKGLISKQFSEDK
jgi:GT2 family glycosyltransferase